MSRYAESLVPAGTRRPAIPRLLDAHSSIPMAGPSQKDVLRPVVCEGTVTVKPRMKAKQRKYKGQITAGASLLLYQQGEEKNKEVMINFLYKNGSSVPIPLKFCSAFDVLVVEYTKNVENSYTIHMCLKVDLDLRIKFTGGNFVHNKK